MAIEAKQTAEQEALKARREVERVKAEAEQKVTMARAEAEEIRLKAREISPAMVQMEWIKKWDGKLPQYSMGSSGSLIQLPSSR
jgi:regulator of protease activity HflC (stomatin/prohibitin superfamily)